MNEHYIVIERSDSDDPVLLLALFKSVTVALKFCTQTLKARSARTDMKAIASGGSCLACSLLYGTSDDTWLELHVHPIPQLNKELW